MTFPLSVVFLEKKNEWVVITSYPSAVRLSNQALDTPPETQVIVERLFSAMRLFLSDLRSLLKQDAVEAMLRLRTNMI